jgi:hypothetical protein
MRDSGRKDMDVRDAVTMSHRAKPGTPRMWLAMWPEWGWPVAIFVLGLAVLLVIALRLIVQIPTTGDEPWYLLQSYALAHFHTPDLAPVLRNHALYHQLLGTHPDDHTLDYLGNGERVLAYLPGYAALIALPYALGGRALVVAVQAVAAAATGLLVFMEARRLFGSRLVALVAWLAYLAPLPVALYAGQIFPSTFAACVTCAGYIAATRWLPRASGWRLLAVSALTGALAAALPWLHIKYALVGLALAAIALVALLRPATPPATPPGAPSALDSPSGKERRFAAVLLAGIVIAGFGLIAAYSLRYFGHLTPPNGRQQASLAHPQVGAVVVVYADMFLGPESGLLPWVPLDLLAVPGVILLWRRYAWRGRAIAALLVAQVGIFVTAAFSSVAQATAMPGRFTLECAPFLALGVAAAVAALLPRAVAEDGVRAWWRTLRSRTRSATARSRGWGRRAQGAGLAATGALLLVTLWFAAVGRSTPYLLYPDAAGPALVEKLPYELPGWWFGLFPKLPGQWVTSGMVALTHMGPGAVPVPGAGGGTAGVLGVPGTLAPGAPLAQSALVWMPPGTYRARIALGCDLAPGAETAARVSVIRRDDAHPLAAVTLPLAACQGRAQTVTETLRFASDGYQPLIFTVDGVSATAVVAWPITYASEEDVGAGGA